MSGINKYVSAAFMMLAFVVSGYSHPTGTGTGTEDKKTSGDKEVVETSDPVQEDFQLQIKQEESTPELPVAKADSAYSSLSKFNFLFYFIYKYKYESRSAEELELLTTD